MAFGSAYVCGAPLFGAGSKILKSGGRLRQGQAAFAQESFQFFPPAGCETREIPFFF